MDGHWHGYGPWVGSPASFAQEGNRRPPHPLAPDPTQGHYERYHAAAAAFKNSDLPPLVLSHWHLKRGAASPTRTWDDPERVLDWLIEQYHANPPFERSDGGQTYVSVDAKISYARGTLLGAGDVGWVHYTPGQRIAAFYAVHCPNKHAPELACPLSGNR